MRFTGWWLVCLLGCVAFACDEPAGDLAAAPDGDPHVEESYPPPDDDPAIGVPDDDAGADDAGIEAGAPDRIDSPVPGKVVTYPFGVKNPRYAAGYHTGEDYAAATGFDVVAVRGGTIRWSNDNGGAYGKWMGLDADNGRTYVYCHLSSRLVAPGKAVVAGQVIGKVGATGNVTGPHLHFEDHPKGPFVYAQVRKPAW
jgi:murein DD-endopeptidase MepM/ murein hydrolase activator NlpD